MTTKREPERLYTVQQAAELCGVSPDVVKRAIRATEGPYLRAKKVGVHGSKNPKLVIPASALAAWQEQLEDA